MKTLIALITLISVQTSWACSMAPFDVDRVLSGMKLEKMALAAFELEEQDVDSVNLTKKDGNYIWSNPMCPEGSWVKATYEVTFDPGNDPLSRNCLGIVTVERRIADAVVYPHMNINKPAIKRVLR